ncbi:MAG: hypothetical protein U0L58_10480 [Ruminococcus sp.]|nr:hypothetical protein [Ruminococcus sp.]
MLTVSQDFKDACLNYPVRTELDIYVKDLDLHIYNSSIVSESMVIEQSVCDESDIKFGGAIASSFEIDVFGVPDLTGKSITVTITQSVAIPLYPGIAYPGEGIYPGGKVLSESFEVFTGRVFSCKLDKNHITRKIVAYDDFYWIGGVNCEERYSKMFPDLHDKVRAIESLRQGFCSLYGILEQYPDDVLPTDNILTERAEGKITVAEIFRCICEMSAAFCFLNGDGKLEYHTISTRGDIPDTIRKPGTENYGFNYSDCSYEEYERTVSGMYHRAKNGFVNWFGYEDPSSPKMYFLEDNALLDAYGTYTSWDHELGVEDDGVQRWRKIEKLLYFEPYRPFTLTTPCRLWVQLCDKITFNVHSYSVNNGIITMDSNPTTISSYVFSRRIKGIQAMTDEFSASAVNVLLTEKDYEEG